MSSEPNNPQSNSDSTETVASTPETEQRTDVASEPAKTPLNEPAKTPLNEPAKTPLNEPAKTPLNEPAKTPLNEPAESQPKTEPVSQSLDKPTETDAKTQPATTPVNEAPTEPPIQPSPARKVSIGSQRDAADKSLTPTQPKAVQQAVANPIDLTGKPKPVLEPLAKIKSDTGFSDDVDAEIEAAISEFSMDDVVEKAEASKLEIEPNTRVKAAVTKIHEDNVFVKLSGQYEGVAALHHFKAPPKEGDLVEVIVRSLNKEDGLYELAVPGASIGIADWDDITEGAVVDARVTGSNTGGLEVTVNAIRGFIPASQIDRFRVEDFGAYINQKLPCVVVEVNPDKRKLILSHRAILDRENEEKRIELLKELEAGQLRDGTITKLMDFGAFVDLGGVEGLIHISKISWSRVKHPSEVVQVGEKVRVKVEKIDADANRISLSLRDTLENPWNTVSDQFNVNDIVKGSVTRIADFGAFVKIGPGIEGLVHISELAYQRVAKVSNILSEGQEIEVKIQSIDKDSQKISLSHKACLAPPAPKTPGPGKSKESEVEEPARELAVPDSGKPLKGGTDRKSGGEEIGLKW